MALPHNACSEADFLLRCIWSCFANSCTWGAILGTFNSRWQSPPLHGLISLKTYIYIYIYSYIVRIMHSLYIIPTSQQLLATTSICIWCTPLQWNLLPDQPPSPDAHLSCNNTSYEYSLGLLGKVMTEGSASLCIALGKHFFKKFCCCTHLYLYSKE